MRMLRRIVDHQRALSVANAVVGFSVLLAITVHFQRYVCGNEVLTGGLLTTYSISKCFYRDCTSLIWTPNIAFYAGFSRKVDEKILIWKYLTTATPRVRDWNWQILTRQVWPKCFPMIFTVFRTCVTEFTNEHFSESRTMKKLQNLT